MTVSIIIPVYNVAPYLRECLDSVLAQTFTDWEAICVDDGSTDGSGAILDEYAVKDKRLKVYHQENKGVSEARQVGLDTASGMYIGFVDPDDWIDSGMFESLVRTAEENDADYVWENFSLDSARGVGRSEVVVCKDCYGIINSLLTGKVLASLCVRFFKLDFLRKHGIRFLPGRIRVCEDLCFICEVLAKHPKCKYCDASHYHYRDVKDSITHTLNIGTFDSWKIVCKRLDELLKGTPSELSLSAFCRECRFSAFMAKCVSNEYFYDFLPDVKTSDGIKAGRLRKMLFWFAVHGMRSKVMILAGIVRRVKALLGMRTQI